VRRDVLVVGIGNDARGDDGVGPYVARAVAAAAGERVDVAVLGDDPMALLDLGTGRARVVVVDAGVTGAEPGTVRQVDPGAAAVLASAGSTHALGIDVVLPIGIALGRLPRETRIWVVEAARFEPGEPLDPRVREGCDRLVESLVREATGQGPERALRST